MSYCTETYILKCKQLNIMPIVDRFDFLDLIFFFKVVKGLVPVELPPYLTLYQGNTRLRSSHLDKLCYVSSLSPRSATNAFAKSFFFRTHTKWNCIPLDIREIDSITEFKSHLTVHMWKNIMFEIQNEVSDDSFWVVTDIIGNGSSHWFSIFFVLM